VAAAVSCHDDDDRQVALALTTAAIAALPHIRISARMVSTR
jgi:hypothetical protein